MADLLFSNLIEGKPLAIRKNGISICVAKVGNDVFAIENNCTHQDAELSDGEQDGYKLECFLHGAQFDLRTGEALTPPAINPVKTFPVKISNDEVIVEA